MAISMVAGAGGEAAGGEMSMWTKKPARKVKGHKMKDLAVKQNQSSGTVHVHVRARHVHAPIEMTT